MRLARKITLAIATAILAIMLLHAYVLLRREVVLFDADLARSVRLKQMLRASIETVWQAYGEDAAQQLVEHTIGNAIEGVRVRWLWLDVPAGDPRHVDLAPDQLAQLRDGERVIVFRKDGATRGRYTYVPEDSDAPGRARVRRVDRRAARLLRGEPCRSGSRPSPSSPPARAAVYGLGAWYVGRPIERLATGCGRRGRRPRYRIILARTTRSATSREVDGMPRRLADARRRSPPRPRRA